MKSLNFHTKMYSHETFFYHFQILWYCPNWRISLKNRKLDYRLSIVWCMMKSHDFKASKIILFICWISFQIYAFFRQIQSRTTSKFASLYYWALDWKILEKWAKFKNQRSSIIFTFLRSFFGWKSKDQKGRVQQKGQGDRHDGIHDPVKFDSFVSITFQPIQNGIFIEQIIYKELKLDLDKRKYILLNSMIFLIFQTWRAKMYNYTNYS